MLTLDSLFFKLFRKKDIFERVHKLGCDLDYVHPFKGTVLHVLIKECFWYPDKLPGLLEYVLKHSTKHIRTRDPVSELEPLALYMKNKTTLDYDVVHQLVSCGATLKQSFLTQAINTSNLEVASLLISRGVSTTIVPPSPTQESIIGSVLQKKNVNLKLVNLIWRTGGCSLQLLTYGLPFLLKRMPTLSEHIPDEVICAVVFYSMWPQLRLLLLASTSPPVVNGITIPGDVWSYILHHIVESIRILVNKQTASQYLAGIPYIRKVLGIS